MALLRGGTIVTLAPGQVHYWEYTIDNGRDVGVARAGPSVSEPSANGRLTAGDQAVAGVPGDERSSTVVYSVTVTNTGSNDMTYTLNAGFFE
jgi:hypothetical protein